ncbi:MAG: GNAT family N-acetyltransferase [Bacteroidetes bacterium]|nr:GNAT family N-acetyltransferase [Bacteroidota bacterium]
MAITFAYNLEDTGACARYQSLWEQTGGIFASLSYAKATASAFGLKPKFWFANDQAALLAHVKAAGLLQRIVVPPCTQYSALLLLHQPQTHLIHRQKSPIDQLLECVERTSNRADLLFTIDDPRTAQWRNWNVRPLFTYLIHLPSKIENWSSTARRTWRSNRDKYDINESPSYASEVIDLCRMSYERHGRSLPAAPKALKSICMYMGESARVFVAERDGVVEAGVIILHDDHTAHYWVAGSIPGDAMTVLIGEMLQRLASSKLSVFDFVGANTPSIAEFKRSFNPVLTQYYHLQRRSRFNIGR